MNCSPVTVRKWRKRWKTFESIIEQIEKELDNKTANKVNLLDISDKAAPPDSELKLAVFS